MLGSDGSPLAVDARLFLERLARFARGDVVRDGSTKARHGSSDAFS